MNKLLYVLLGVALLVGGLVGYALHPQSFGAQTVTDSVSLGRLETQNFLNGVNNILQFTSASGTFAPGSIATSTVNYATSTTFTVTSAVGDSVLVGLSTSTAGVSVNAAVTAANTITLTLTNTLNSGASVSPATSTYYFTVIPKTSFKTLAW